MDIGVALVSSAWQGLLDEIARWRDVGRTVDFWWRDDDACRPDPALARLIALATAANVPLALAVIPQDAQAAAFQALGSLVTLMQHGVDHNNRAGPAEKKTEFPASEPLAAALVRLVQGRKRLEQVASGLWLPVLVPPWNRVSATELIPRLAEAGYRGLSTFGPRQMPYAAPGLVMVNTHVDVIDWRGSRGFVGEDLALSQATRHLKARRAGSADADESTGWLTHHAVHDEAAWLFIELLLERTRTLQAVRWRSASELFVARSA